jgi:hypothetical protein
MGSTGTLVLWRIQNNLPHQHFPNRVISHSLFVSFDLYLILVQIVETETQMDYFELI